jgi:hypothetical protein
MCDHRKKFDKVSSAIYDVLVYLMEHRGRVVEKEESRFAGSYRGV